MNANEEWKRKNTVMATLRLNRNTDAEIINWIESIKQSKGSVAAEIKKAILNYIGGAQDE